MLAIGRDKPWNSAWTGEEAFEVRPCKYAGGHLAVWQKTNPGVGKPLFDLPIWSGSGSRSHG